MMAFRQSNVPATPEWPRSWSIGFTHPMKKDVKEKRFDPAVKAAGLKDFTWHGVRHTYASRFVMAGVDLRTVQDLTGHKTIQMTVRYMLIWPRNTNWRLCSGYAILALHRLHQVTPELTPVNLWILRMQHP